MRRIMMFQQFVLYYIFVQCTAAIIPLLVLPAPMTGLLSRATLYVTEKDHFPDTTRYNLFLIVRGVYLYIHKYICPQVRGTRDTYVSLCQSRVSTVGALITGSHRYRFKDYIKRVCMDR